MKDNKVLRGKLEKGIAQEDLGEHTNSKLDVRSGFKKSSSNFFKNAVMSK